MKYEVISSTMTLVSCQCWKTDNIVSEIHCLLKCCLSKQAVSHFLELMQTSSKAKKCWFQMHRRSGNVNRGAPARSRGRSLHDLSYRSTQLLLFVTHIFAGAELEGQCFQLQIALSIAAISFLIVPLAGGGGGRS